MSGIRSSDIAKEIYSSKVHQFQDMVGTGQDGQGNSDDCGVFNQFLNKPQGGPTGKAQGGVKNVIDTVRGEIGSQTQYTNDFYDQPNKTFYQQQQQQQQFQPSSNTTKSGSFGQQQQQYQQYQQQQQQQFRPQGFEKQQSHVVGNDLMSQDDSSLPEEDFNHLVSGNDYSTSGFQSSGFKFYTPEEMSKHHKEYNTMSKTTWNVNTHIGINSLLPIYQPMGGNKNGMSYYQHTVFATKKMTLDEYNNDPKSRVWVWDTDILKKKHAQHVVLSHARYTSKNDNISLASLMNNKEAVATMARVASKTKLIIKGFQLEKTLNTSPVQFHFDGPVVTPSSSMTSMSGKTHYVAIPLPKSKQYLDHSNIKCNSDLERNWGDTDNKIRLLKNFTEEDLKNDGLVREHNVQKYDSNGSSYQTTEMMVGQNSVFARSGLNSEILPEEYEIYGKSYDQDGNTKIPKEVYHNCVNKMFSVKQKLPICNDFGLILQRLEPDDDMTEIACEQGCRNQRGGVNRQMVEQLIHEPFEVSAIGTITFALV